MLTSAELAHASVMAALTAATAIVGSLVPFAAALSVLATVPMGLLAYRYRLTVVITSTVAGCTIAFLVAGAGGAATVANCAYVGGVTGIVMRRKRGMVTVTVVGAVAGAILGGGAALGLIVLTQARVLMFDSLTATVDGVVAVLRHVPRLDPLADLVTVEFSIVLRHWAITLIAASVVGICGATIVGWWALSRVLTRLAGVPDVHRLDAPGRDGPVGPVPMALHGVRVRYAGADHDALGPISLIVGPGEHVAVTGANGAGKTTLMLVLAGRPPTTGTVERPGGVGLGRPGGTAVIMQHCESQVLGMRVRDDVVWGLPAGAVVDIDDLLANVGLAGMGDRNTEGLSGGELQRLAVAAALARQPSLMIADEVTSMVDPRGHGELVTVLAELTRRERMSLVHITHYQRDAECADRIVRLGAEGRDDDVAMVATASVPASIAAGAANESAVFTLIGVGHQYAPGTPWSHTALRDIGFTIGAGEGVLIHGNNGSGKSTLAWLMAGLMSPTVGSCLVNGAPASRQTGSVALSFQAAHLQLLRARVDREIAAAAGFDAADKGRIEAALALVGLEPAFASRRIDQLSGGQQRRVALAGLLARAPRALILDEPLAGLDAGTAASLVRLLAELRRTRGITIVVISHDFSGLREVCPRVLHLENGSLMRPARSAR